MAISCLLLLLARPSESCSLYCWCHIVTSKYSYWLGIDKILPGADNGQERGNAAISEADTTLFDLEP